MKYDEKSCGVVVFSDGAERRFLLLHYPNGHWDLAKGHVEAGESEHETAARELFEETGISQIEFLDGFREEISYTYNKAGKISNKQVVFFLGKTSQTDVTLSHEHHNSSWLPYEEAYAKVTFDNAKQLIQKAKIFLES